MNNFAILDEKELYSVEGGSILFVLGCVGLGVLATGFCGLGIYNGYCEVKSK